LKIALAIVVTLAGAIVVVTLIRSPGDPVRPPVASPTPRAAADKATPTPEIEVTTTPAALAEVASLPARGVAPAPSAPEPPRERGGAIVDVSHDESEGSREEGESNTTAHQTNRGDD
jgi:hypothetical protein